MLSRITSYVDPLSLREKLINALAAALAMLVLGLLLQGLPHPGVGLPLMASMGASAFLLFVLPHSPMAQPWPLLGGHAIAAMIALTCGQFIDHAVLAVAIAVGASVLAMQLLHCLHPPAAATALAVAMIEGPLTAQAVSGVAYSVVGGAALLLAVAVAINHLLLNRRYPMQHSHHPHHERFQREHAKDPLRLEEEDIDWALGQMDGIVAATKEDLMDVYELAQERALTRSGNTSLTEPRPARARKRAG
ncbi:MAG: HPP family protein [Gammaproteobacteria bacterium]|jgi:CBS-domain-containing membrane protein|nr:HPP family protein [Gammaproteobacteria bacterium]